MAREAINFGTPMDELFSEGSMFAAGIYEVLKAGFTYFDFGKPGNDSLCFMMELQGEDGNALDRPRYWPVGGTLKDGTKLIEPCNPVKGEKGLWAGIRFTDADKSGKLYKRTDFAIFIEHCQKAELDMDSIGNDLTSFAGNRYEFGLFTVKHEQKSGTVSEAEGEKPKRESHDVVVIVREAKAGKKGASKPKAKPAADDDDADEKPKAKGGKAKTPEALVLAYVEENIVPEVDNDGEADYLSHKLALSKHLAKDLGLEPDEVKAAMAVYNDREDALPELLAGLDTPLTINADKQIVKKGKAKK